MRIIEKYILNQLLLPFFYCLILIIAIYLLLDLATSLKEFMREKAGFYLIVKYFYYSLPAKVIEMIPMSFLIAIIYSLTKLNRYNEILAMRAAGINWLVILRPYFTFAVLICFISFWINEKIVPPFQKKFIKIEKRIKKIAKEKMNNVTFYATGNKIIFAAKYSAKEGKFINVVIMEQTYDGTTIFKTTAKLLFYRNGKWIMEDLTIYKLNSEGQLMDKPIRLVRKQLSIKETPQELLEAESEAKYLPAKYILAKLLEYGNISLQIKRQLLLEFYRKFSYPFTPLILGLIGVLIGLRARHTSLLKGLTMALAIGFVYYVLDATAYSSAKTGFIPTALGAWLANIFFLSLGITLILKKIILRS